MVDFSNYRAYHLLGEGRYSSMTRAEARASFSDLMSARDDRAGELRRLVNEDGADFDSSDAGVQQLEDWIRGSIARELDRAEVMDPTWYAVGLDVGLFLGDLLISRRPELDWKLSTAGGRSSVFFHWPVIAGFSIEGLEVCPTQSCLRLVDRLSSGSSPPDAYLLSFLEGVKGTESWSGRGTGGPGR